MVSIYLQRMAGGTRHSYVLDAISGMVLESQSSDTSGANRNEVKLTTY